MGGKSVKKSYPIDFKKKAVAMSLQEGITVGEVADELAPFSFHSMHFSARVSNDDRGQRYKF
jgi:transposase-like protein